jgi:hypothetical protein
MNDVQFQEGQGGLGRPLPNNDHISALLFYTGGSLPSGFATTSVATRCKAVYSPDDAVNNGILKDYSDATAATGSYTFTGVGAAGDVVELKVADIDPNTGNPYVDSVNYLPKPTTLGAYTRLSTDTTVTILATSYAAFINAGTSTHGYSATSSVGAVTITAPKRLGAYLNGLTSITATITGTITGTIVQFTGGVASRWIQYYYQIKEFFRNQPKGKLWVGFFGVPGSYTFSEVTDMQNNSIGEIRQIGVYKDAVWSTADITALNNVCIANKLAHQPIMAVYAANLQATSDITTIADVSTLISTANTAHVQTCLGQDGGGWGNFIYKTNGTAGIKSITCLGAQLGEIAARKVSESQAWVGVANLSNGTELEVPAFCNGQLVSALSSSALDAINTKRHVFLRKFNGYSGTYFNDSHCCILQSSDYAYFENGRTLFKAERILYTTFLPYLNSPIKFNANGTLADTTIAGLEGVGNTALDQMVRDDEISAKSVTINPLQNVLSTSQLVIAVTLVINGVARNIIIPIGFKPSIA